MKLSILVPTVPRRMDNCYVSLIKKLEAQVATKTKIELIGFYDNKQRTTGEKRNNLLFLAKGEYLVFIDDDDDIANDYIGSICDALHKNPGIDCIVFDCITTVNGKNPVHSEYSIHHEYRTFKSKPDMPYHDEWRGRPAHTMVWKSSIAKKHIYQDKNYEEDVQWVKRAYRDIKTEFRIPKVLYYYKFNDGISEIRGTREKQS